MRKYLAILVIVWFAVVAMPAHNQVGGKRTAAQSQQSAQQPSAPSVAPITNNQATTYYQQESTPKPQGWHKLTAWPEGITALAIVLTLLAIIWQSIWTQLSVRASRDSIKLQEAAMQQWVVLSNWRTEIITHSGLLYADGTPRHRLRVQVDIVNPSKFPLTLKEATIVFRLPINSPSTYYAPKDHFLTPNAPHTVDVPLDIGSGWAESYRDGIVAFGIEGKFTHIGALKRKAIQDMKGLIVCSAAGTRFESEMPMHPKEAPQPDS